MGKAPVHTSARVKAIIDKDAAIDDVSRFSQSPQKLQPRIPISRNCQPSWAYSEGACAKLAMTAVVLQMATKILSLALIVGQCACVNLKAFANCAERLWRPSYLHAGGKLK